jgi:hypothetical protein
MEKSIDEEFPPLFKKKKKNNKRQDLNIFNRPTNYSHKNKISKADTQWHFIIVSENHLSMPMIELSVYSLLTDFLMPVMQLSFTSSSSFLNFQSN